jgi:hypothetical protein
VKAAAVTTWIIVLIVIVIALVLAFSTLTKDELLHDPFLPYADLLSKELIEAAASKRHFSCAFVMSETRQKCSLRPNDGLFSEIRITIKTVPESVFFGVVRNALRVGDLVALWGQPEVAWPGSQPVLSWANRPARALVCTRSADQRLKMNMSVCSVSFEL